MEFVIFLVIPILILVVVASSDGHNWGSLNKHIICPHCQTQGKVRTKEVEKKVGISGGKATAAILTGGVSLLATGLSRKSKMTQAHCCQCKSTWLF
jgi:hypothetical protein